MVDRRLPFLSPNVDGTVGFWSSVESWILLIRFDCDIFISLQCKLPPQSHRRNSACSKGLNRRIKSIQLTALSTLGFDVVTVVWGSDTCTFAGEWGYTVDAPRRTTLCLHCFSLAWTLGAAQRTRSLIIFLSLM
jgi:hypothetical protein